MNILGLETATSVCSVGIVREGGEETEKHLRDPRIHSERILTLVDEVLRVAGIGFRNLDAIAVSRGPGSFTGLRIGYSTAKGLCYATGLPLVEVPTFDAIATAASIAVPTAGNILVALDAKKGDFYSAVYEFRAGQMANAGEATVGPVAVSGSPGNPELIITDREDVLRPTAGAGADIRPVHDFCRGNVVAALGAERFRAGFIADLASCEPAYLKDFVVKGTRT